MSFIKNNFLLSNKTAEKLYFDYAKNMPIFDYHCHLSEKQILANEEFKDIFEVWLGGDHYKWRLMRNYGIDEEYITGNKPNKEKFRIFCRVVGSAFANPIYHWSQLELETYFNCPLEINEENADAIWDLCNSYIKENHLTPQKVIEASNVKHIFTTNEIFDDLSTFEKIQQKDYKFSVNPAFRADKIMNIEAEKYNEFVDKLGDIKTLDELENIVEKRLIAFIKVGCKASDTALQAVYPLTSKEQASLIFDKRRNGQIINEEESQIFKGYFTYFLFKLYAKYDIASELHVGAMRNNNTKMLNKLGLDTGYDSIAEDNSIKNMSRLFDQLNNENSLPKTIVFNLNPKMNTEIMTLIGAFQDSSAKGKMQFGPAWWFLDNKVGMENHLKDLTATGHIDAFNGMLTDSRSFLSYPRHHYFRRILCNYLGVLVENGEITSNLELIGKTIKNVSYYNAVNYFKMEE